MALRCPAVVSHNARCNARIFLGYVVHYFRVLLSDLRFLGFFIVVNSCQLDTRYEILPAESLHPTMTQQYVPSRYN